MDEKLIPEEIVEKFNAVEQEIYLRDPEAIQALNDIKDIVISFQAKKKALEEIIQLNRQTAKDKYGDAEKAELWACVKIARKAIES